MFNIVIYVRVMEKLSRQSAQKIGLTKKHSQTKNRLKNAAVFLLLLGLTWSVGYLTLIQGATFLFQLFFCVLNSMKGYFIFMVYVIRRPEGRKFWSALLKKKFDGTFMNLRSKIDSSDRNRVTSSSSNTREVSANQLQSNMTDRRRLSFAPDTVPLSEVERVLMERRKTQREDIEVAEREEHVRQDDETYENRETHVTSSNGDERSPILGTENVSNGNNFRHGYF